MKSRKLLSVSAIAGLGALQALALGLASVPAAAATQRAPAVRVDLSPLGGGLEGQALARCLPAAASRVLAGRSLPGPVVVRIKAVSINSNESGSAGSGRGFESGTSSDYIEGEAFVGSQRYPLLSAVPAQRYLGRDIRESTVLRVNALCEHLAYWLPWSLGIR